MTTISIIDIKQNELEAKAVWNEIFSQDKHASAFLSWEWISSWKNYFSDNRELQLVYITDVNNLPVAALPIMIEPVRLSGISLTKRIQLLGADSLACSEHLGFLIKEGTDIDLLHQLLTHLWQNHGNKKYLLFSELDIDSREKEIVAHWSHNMAIRQETKSRGGCWQVELPDTWDSFLAKLSSNFRQQIRRSLRKIAQSSSFSIRQISESKEVESVTYKLMELNQSRMAGKGVNSCFNTQAMRDFFVEMSVGMVASKKAWLDALFADGEIVAASLHLVDNTTVAYYQGGFDEQFAKQKPMVVLFATAIQRAIEQNKIIYDFLGGNESYKQRWGATLKPYTSLSLLPSSTGQQMLIQLFELYHRAKAAKAYYFP